MVPEMVSDQSSSGNIREWRVASVFDISLTIYTLPVNIFPYITESDFIGRVRLRTEHIDIFAGRCEILIQPRIHNFVLIDSNRDIDIPKLCQRTV